MARLIHIPAQPIRIGNQLRQRCAWCGATLIDMDLSSVTIVPSSPGMHVEPSTWEPGSLVAVDGPASYLVDHQDGDRLPADACGQIDHEVTR